MVRQVLLPGAGRVGETFLVTDVAEKGGRWDTELALTETDEEIPG